MRTRLDNSRAVWGRQQVATAFICSLSRLDLWVQCFFRGQGWTGVCSCVVIGLVAWLLGCCTTAATHKTFKLDRIVLEY